MLLNSVHEQYPNNDPKQCTVTKLGWVHCMHTQNPGRTHTARTVPISWALLRAQQADRAHVARTVSAGRAHVGRALVATHPGSLHPGRDLTSKSRHQGSQNHVATSNRCRDIEVARNMSRHQIDVTTPPRTLQVTTSKRGRDTKPPVSNPPRSRRSFLVATSR